jgi:CheY-like chemotaxis protein
MDAEAHKLLDHIDESVSAMGGLFGGLLDISRLDAGVVEVNLRGFAIQPLLERICSDYRAEAAAKGVRLRLRRCSLAVRSDPLLLERVIRNIVANAVTYTDRGRVLVGCRRGNHLSIQVWDTGEGIPPDRQEHVFQEFFQLGNPERDRTKGVGLGLAIVRRLTTLLGHKLQLLSRVGAGSVFAVSVPLATASEVVSEQTDETLTRTMVKGSGLVLFVDDEPAIQIAMQRLLQDWGYETIVASSGAEMLERLATCDERPALIICDYRLRAHETGIAVIHRLRTEYNHDIPGMLLTGDTAPDRLKEAQESGLLLLHKPTQNSRLRAAINSLIRASLADTETDVARGAMGRPT